MVLLAVSKASWDDVSYRRKIWAKLSTKEEQMLLLATVLDLGT